MAVPTRNAQALFDKILSLPTDRIAEVEDFVDFLKQRAKDRKTIANKQALNFPVISVGQWPTEFGLSREDMYGDDGR